jgi:hypothetical protein
VLVERAGSLALELLLPIWIRKNQYTYDIDLATFNKRVGINVNLQKFLEKHNVSKAMS